MKINPQIFADAADDIPSQTYACCAISVAATGHAGKLVPEREFFTRLYGLGDPVPYSFGSLAAALGGDLISWWLGLDYESKCDFRVWALCFAHAAATYRRPKSRTAKRRFR